MYNMDTDATWTLSCIQLELLEVIGVSEELKEIQFYFTKRNVAVNKHGR